MLILSMKRNRRTNGRRDLNLPVLMGRMFTLLFAAVWVLSVVQFLSDSTGSGGQHWLDAALLFAAALSLASVLCHQLPLQNTILACAVIGLGGGAVHWLSLQIAIPFGPIQFTGRMGPSLPGGLPWAIPLIWVVLILTARGVARLILRPWEARPDYGILLLGSSAVLVVLQAVGLEGSASGILRYWLWPQTTPTVPGLEIPSIALMGWGAAALLVLLLATPALIKKRPGLFPPGPHSLLMWLLLNGWFGIVGASEERWDLVVFSATNGLCVAALAAANGLRTSRS